MTTSPFNSKRDTFGADIEPINPVAELKRIHMHNRS